RRCGAAVVQIQPSDSAATLYAILDAGYRPSEIEVTRLGLEQAFLAITAEDDRTNRTTHLGETNCHSRHTRPHQGRTQAAHAQQALLHLNRGLPGDPLPAHRPAG